MDQPIRILFPGPTSLYAPIYIAKEAALTHVFNRVELVHALPDYISNKDRIYDGLLSRNKEHEVKIVVADPLRLFELVQQTGTSPVRLCNGSYFRPQVVGGLVLNESFHHFHDPFNGSKLDQIADTDSFFVTSEEPTTGFVVAYNALAAKMSSPDPARIKDALIAHGKIGLVKEFYDLAKKLNRDKRFSYFTPSSTCGDRIDNSGEFLVTGLVTTEDYYRSNAAIVEEIIYGIHLGVMRILNHRRWALRHLRGYIQRHRWLRRPLNEPLLESYLEEAKNYQLYNTDVNLRFNKSAFDVAVQARDNAYDGRRDKPFVRPALVKDAVWSDFFDARCSSPSAVTLTDARHDEHYIALVATRRQTFQRWLWLLVAALLAAKAFGLLCTALPTNKTLPATSNAATLAIADSLFDRLVSADPPPLNVTAVLILSLLFVGTVICVLVIPRILRSANSGFWLCVTCLPVSALQAFVFARLFTGWEAAIGIFVNFLTVFGAIMMVAMSNIHVDNIWRSLLRKYFSWLARRALLLEYLRTAADRALEVGRTSPVSLLLAVRHSTDDAYLSREVEQNSRKLHRVARHLEA